MIRDKIKRAISGLKDLVWQKKPEKPETESGSQGVAPLNRKGRRLMQMEIGRLVRKNVRRALRHRARMEGRALHARVKFRRLQV